MAVEDKPKKVLRGPVPVTEGEWAGWSQWQSDAFDSHVGPFYERLDENGQGVCAIRVEKRHLNGGGFVHGGCLMTLADNALFIIARAAMGDFFGVTMSLSADFLAAGQEGQLLEARGEVVRGGGKTVFVRGMISAEGVNILSFNGIIRKTVKRPG